jgi:cellulose synthase/poly-beta-1,6-N-acetylglucosamine synthase-like glycosyltransferase
MSVLLEFVSYVSAIVVLYYSALFAVSLWSTRRTPEPCSGHEPFFILVIPAHNEELVITETVKRASALDSDRYLVLILNDGSKDATGTLARGAAEGSDRVIVVDRPPDVAGQGKGEVLNHAYRLASEWTTTGDSRLLNAPAEDIILCVVDADGWLEPHALDAVAPHFTDPKVGAVQLPVGMWNSRDGFLALMQDMEFIGFSLFVQAGRDPFNSVGLGGNGQFVRLAALQTLGDKPWGKCLTEDLDLSLSLIEAGWRNRLCPKARVAQQGLSRVRPLLRQRTRWIQGHYSCWQHLPALWRAKGVPLRTKVDLSLYLTLVVFVLVLATQVTVGILEWAGVITPRGSFLGFVHDAPTYRVIVLALSLGPVLGFAITYQRFASRPLPWWAVPGCLLMFAVYNYAWSVPASLRALARTGLRRDSWIKTPRTAVGEHAVVSEASQLAGTSP